MADSFAVIICAAGASSRFAGKRKKPFVDVGGRAIFMRSVEFFAGRDDVKQILVAIDKEDEELVKVKWGPNLKFHNAQICFGGAERVDTVKAALEQVKEGIDFIAVHDAVRCCLKKEWIEECFSAAAKSGSAILASPVTATLKEAKDRTVTKTVSRSGLWEAQTPQVFRAELLKKAYANLENADKSKISDDAQLVEALGAKILIVEGDSSNIKITRKSDVTIAEGILRSRPRPKPKGPMGPYVEAQW